jgi:hypothetical protein
MILDFCSSVFLVPQIQLLLLHQKGEKKEMKNLSVGNPHELVGNQTAFSYYTFGKFFISKPFPCSLPLT